MGGAPEDGTIVELKDYWQTVQRRWKLIVVVFLLCVAAAGFLTWQATPKYSSSARIFVSTTPSDTNDALAGNTFAAQRASSYVDLVGTRKLAESVASNLGGTAANDPEGLRAAISAEVVPETVNIVLTATDPDPAEARDIAQAYAEALSDLVADLETPRGQANALITASIVDNAQVSSSPVSPQPVRNIGLGAVLGLLLGLGLAVLRDLMDNTLSSSDDIALVTSAPILGHINSDPAAVKKAPAVALAESSPWAEAFRVLRTNMQYVDVDHERRVFVVSSSLPAEGKSTTAVNLAITLSLAGERVALVECDLRRPLIARRLGLDEAVGTTSVLIGKVSLDDALQTYDGTDLKVLACGQLPPNPSELLQSQAMEVLIKDLRERFDVVILDTPPLLPVTDAALLSAQADGMLAVVRHGKTTRDQLRHALERVEQVDAKCVGVVVNLAPAKKSTGYGYGYGYSYAPLKGGAGKHEKVSDASVRR
ncbi:polysaccharide biosynthesis tyrosine autokinase [Nocardioides sp. cx-169]|uniref:polysaccharide biosynthesis tyrosine autokinase n=1 Tax=Nocardioides sp. cx-169 TaxID=2899080 RepID=UPI001E50B74F|nr:polysaccharide biosynthesis tyrosine autokinase [Nocardioides sp. cx-169]MCD4533762.1 polysaccharide biosynthesis tyrosine autokinase [Nocardioides sp. cx-169]